MIPFSKKKRVRNQKLLDEFRSIGRCIACGSDDNIQVHHIKTKGTGGGDVPSNLLVVCFACHRAIHDQGNRFYKTKPHLMEYLAKMGWLWLEKRLIHKDDFKG